jgi:hypothetical protein
MPKTPNNIPGVACALIFACAIGGVSVAQTQKQPLSDAEVTKLREQSAAFKDITSEANPVLRKRMSVQETKLTKLLEKLSDAEARKDTALASKLADELGSVESDLVRLHEAQADLGRMSSINQLVAVNLANEQPTGEVCNGGHCADISGVEAIIIILTAGLTDELKKKQPFGPNNDIMKALHSIGEFIQCIFGCK